MCVSGVLFYGFQALYKRILVQFTLASDIIVSDTFGQKKELSFMQNLPTPISRRDR